MAIEKTSFLYEALIRFGPQGYEGSHQIWTDRYIDTVTDEIISEKQRPAEPLAEAAIVDLVGGQALVMAGQITALEAELAAKVARIGELEAASPNAKL